MSPFRILAAGLLAVLCAFMPAPACAEACSIREHDGSKTAFVIKPGKSSEFNALVRDKRYAEAAECCLACSVPAGTRVVVTSSGGALHAVRVAAGAHSGCVGELPKDQVGNCR